MKRILSSVFLATLFFGCSGDGDNVVGDGGPRTDGAQDAALDNRTAADVSADRATQDGFIDIFDAFPIPDGPFSGCITCVRDRCSAEVNQCVNDDACRAGLFCTLMTCTLGASGPDPLCALACFKGDVNAALKVAGAYMCLSSNCSAACLGAGDAGPGDADASRTPDADAHVDGGADVLTGDAEGDGGQADGVTADSGQADGVGGDTGPDADDGSTLADADAGTVD